MHLMTAINDNTQDQDEQSDNYRMYQTEMQRNACVDPKNDSEDAQRRKIQYFTSRFDRFLKNSYEMGMLEVAISTMNHDFVDDAINWQINLNRVRNRKTPLDVVLEDREGTLTGPIGYTTDSVTRANVRFDDLKAYDLFYHKLRAAGGRHYSELATGEPRRLVDAAGTWRGTVSSTDNRLPSRFDFEYSVRSENGVWSGEITIPERGMQNVQLVNVKQIGNGLSFTVPGLKPITVQMGVEVKYFGGGFHIDGMEWGGLLTDASGRIQIPFTARRVSGRTHWPSLQAKQAEILRTIEGTWVSDGSGKESPRKMTLRNQGSSVSGTVVYKAGAATVEESVVGELIGERWLIVRGTGYRLLEGTVTGFNLDTWKLDLSWDGRRLHGTEGDVRSAFNPRMFLKQ